MQSILSTSSLVRPSYTIRATIFEKVFWPEKTRQADKQSINLKEGAIKCCNVIKITAPPNAWRNIPLKAEKKK